ncbi:11763_t:CDS:1 [Paraglomus brasilianum]|uniref:11763_t:CDS:1 n=1 Tax=Paraglomus brasilianum TaxID=144538 RepID=A0A9N9AM44_9GLOM|nr:11763_t:CDS:1 [Paraglomus brasilianum]
MVEDIPKNQKAPGKGKSKIISVASSAATLIRDVVPTSANAVTDGLASIVHGKSGSNMVSTVTRREWKAGMGEHVVSESRAGMTLESSSDDNMRVKNHQAEDEWKNWHNASQPDIDNLNIGYSHDTYSFNHEQAYIDSTFNDGADVLNFLNSTSFVTETYNLANTERDLISRRSRNVGFVDPSSLSKPYIDRLLEAQDIVEYIAQTTYSDDIYGLPDSFKKLIDDARNEIMDNTEIHQRTAVERLRMFRDHLIKRREEKGDGNSSWLDEWNRMEE